MFDTFEYDSKCYKNCPNGTNRYINFDSENNLYIDCKLNSSFLVPDEVDNNKIIISNFYNEFNVSLNKNDITKDFYYEFQKNQMIVKFTSINYFKYYKKPNKTEINLGLCEYILKDVYNISYNESLYILFLEIPQEGMKIPKIEYSIYYIKNKNNSVQLDLAVCKDTKIEISRIVSIEGNIDKYNSSSGYYNDLCYLVTSEYGTDICLKDRRKEFIEKNLTLCEEDCDLISYNYTNNKAKCSCKIKTNIPILENVKFDKEKLKKNFIDIDNIANIKLMKCYKIVFKKSNIKHNFGFYIMNSIFFLFFLFLFLFYYRYYYLLIVEINKLISTFGKQSICGDINNNNKNIIAINIIKTENNNESNRKKNKIKIKIKVKKVIKVKKKINSTSNFNIKNNRISIPLYQRNKTKLSEHSKSKINLLYTYANKISIISNNTNNLNYNNSELNSLSYEEALKYDKRSFFQYYISLLKINQLLLFSFYPNEDYNSKIIKMFLFFFFFASELSINALFFTDETMHQIYEDKGSFNFLYQIPQIIYSTILSLVFDFIIKYFSLSEENVSQIKEEKRKNSKDIYKKLKKLFKMLKIKFILFFIISPIILFLFWFYITCFCGVYKNTQNHLINDTLLSFLTSLLFPLATAILPGILRIFSLKSKKNNKEYLYKISQFLENI